MEILAFSCLWPKSFYVQCRFTQKCGSIHLIIAWICEMLNSTFSFRSGFIISGHGILIWEYRCKSHITFSDWSDWKKLFTQKNGNFDYCAGIFMSVTKIILCKQCILTLHSLSKQSLSSWKKNTFSCNNWERDLGSIPSSGKFCETIAWVKKASFGNKLHAIKIM